MQSQTNTFEDNLYLTRSLTSDDNVPLPNASMVVPKGISMWNVCKPVGDQTTQMAWTINPSIPVKTPHTEATKQTSVVLLVYQVHRLEQIKGAKNDLNKYKSLNSYRDAANQRLTFMQTIGNVMDMLLNMASRYTKITHNHNIMIIDHQE